MEYTNLLRTLDEISKEILDEYKKEIGESNIVRTMTIETIDNGSKFDVVLNLEDYWKYIEYGRKPGKMPPLNKIIDWVKRKGILPTANSKVKTQEQIGYLIARHIGQNGLKPRNLLQKSVEKSLDIENRIAESFAKDVEIELIKKLN